MAQEATVVDGVGGGVRGGGRIVVGVRVIRAATAVLHEGRRMMRGGGTDRKLGTGEGERVCDADHTAPDAINGRVRPARTPPTRHRAAVLCDDDRRAIVQARGVDDMCTGERGRGWKMDVDLGVGQSGVIDVRCSSRDTSGCWLWYRGMAGRHERVILKRRRPRGLLQA